MPEKAKDRKATDPNNELSEHYIDKYGSGLRVQVKSSLVPKLLEILKRWGYRKDISSETNEAEKEERGEKD